MKPFKTPKNIGASDIASLCLRSHDKLELLRFVSDGTYHALLVDDAEETISDRYKLYHTFTKWLKIYDDDGLTAKIYADVINVYRSDDDEVVIQFVGGACEILI